MRRSPVGIAGGATRYHEDLAMIARRIWSRRWKNDIRDCRSGLSRVDVLVAGVVIVVALCLILPAIQDTRGRVMRRTQCLNNLHNLSIAAANVATANDGKLPMLEDGKYGWGVAFLGYLDRNDLIQDGKIQTGVWVDIFVCPNDSDLRKVPGRVELRRQRRVRSLQGRRGWSGFRNRRTQRRARSRRRRPGQRSRAGDQFCDRRSLGARRRRAAA